VCSYSRIKWGILKKKIEIKIHLQNKNTSFAEVNQKKKDKTKAKTTEWHLIEASL
jgi:hypothetical protein